MFFKIIPNINKYLNILGGIMLIFMMLIATSNIIFRFFGHPIKGTFEILGFLGAMVCSLSLAETEQKRGHIQVGLLYEKLPKGIRPVMDIMTLILSVSFWSLVCYKLFQLGFSIKEFGELSETLNIPYYPVVFISAIGVLSSIVLMLLNFFKNKKQP
jgi:TRAP-type C4-dicarboxylate transport system permease small subunit